MRKSFHLNYNIFIAWKFIAWKFNTLERLSLDSEDGFCTGCRDVSKKNSPSQDSNHLDDLFQSRYVNPGFKPFSY